MLHTGHILNKVAAIWYRILWLQDWNKKLLVMKRRQIETVTIKLMQPALKCTAAN